MKVILLQDVAKIGKRGEVAEVPDGYARNQLIPKMMAEPATKANMKKVERKQSMASASSAASEERFAAALEALRADVIKVAAEVNDQGHAFKAVSAEDIVAVAKESGVDVSADMIVISDPIKEVGEHEIELRGESTQAKFSIEVVKK
tara:strand:+ start:35183 stop:35623 length:441 start_codon:yes stop_codon:yes gene_type:complete